MFEREYRDLAHVPRWGVAPVVRRQSVAEHSYFVALYTSHICDVIYGTDYASTILKLNTVRCALEHDRAETYMSDIPGPVKRAVIGGANEAKYVKEEDAKRFGYDFRLDGASRSIVKLADLMDEYAYWVEECRLGNTYFSSIAPHIAKRIQRQAADLQYIFGVDVMELVVTPFYEQTKAEKQWPT